MRGSLALASVSAGRLLRGNGTCARTLRLISKQQHELPVVRIARYRSSHFNVVALQEGDAAEKYLEKEQAATKRRIVDLEAKNAALKKDLAELKVTLKQRFGDAIALDK